MAAGLLKLAEGTTNGTPASGYGYLETLTDGTLQFINDSGVVTKLSGYIPMFTPGGRLTLTTATPITTSDVTAAGTLYYTPYFHSGIWLYGGSYWTPYTFSELSLALTLTSGKNYDVFVYANSGTPTLELSAAWTNDSTRADAFTTQNGWRVKSGATTRLWVGMIRASAANVTEKSRGKCLVWNMYNRVPHEMGNYETTNTWAYGTDSWRKTNNADLTKVEWVNGEATSVRLFHISSVFPTGGEVFAVAIGVDSATSPSNGYGEANASGIPATASVQATVAAGYHYAHGLERARAGTVDVWNYQGAGGGGTPIGFVSINGSILA